MPISRPVAGGDRGSGAHSETKENEKMKRKRKIEESRKKLSAAVPVGSLHVRGTRVLERRETRLSQGAS